MLDNNQFRQLIIQPVLKSICLYSIDAENLLVGTFAQESGCGRYLIQNEDSPNLWEQSLDGKLAVGPYQMQPSTHDDLWKNNLKNKTLGDRINVFCGFQVYSVPSSSTMIYNLHYSTAMARVLYFTFPGDIPSTLEGQAQYYKTHWNTIDGKATTEEYIENYNLFNGIK